MRAIKTTLNSNLILLIRYRMQAERKGSGSLNSNLILLIRNKTCNIKAYMLALNSNLILLIRTQESCGPVSGIFKFQSDSINTGVASGTSGNKPTLNSNLILLIPGHLLYPDAGWHPLNSNLILLILRCCLVCHHCTVL